MIINVIAFFVEYKLACLPKFQCSSLEMEETELNRKNGALLSRADLTLWNAK